MATLHILANPNAASACALALAPGDRLLLLADGAGAVDEGMAARAACVGVLDAGRTLPPPSLPPSVQRLSYGDFVVWVVACERSVTWT